jgi:hypothetical protein
MGGSKATLGVTRTDQQRPRGTRNGEAPQAGGFANPNGMAEGEDNAEQPPTPRRNVFLEPGKLKQLQRPREMRAAETRANGVRDHEASE